MSRFAVATGLRRGNITGLTWDRVDLKAGVVFIPGSAAKGKRGIAAPLNADAIGVLKEQLGEDAPAPIVHIDGQVWLIVDIGLRMLTPRELLNAQFSPEIAKDYILTGTDAEQVKRIGNSVSPPVAAARWTSA